MFASSQVCKYAKLPNYQLQNIKLQSYKLQVYKLHVHVCKFPFIKLKVSHFKIIKKTKIAMQVHVCKYAKLPKITNCRCIFAYLQVFTC
jgi:hypothetical protein